MPKLYSVVLLVKTENFFLLKKSFLFLPEEQQSIMKNIPGNKKNSINMPKYGTTTVYRTTLDLILQISVMKPSFS